MCTQYNVVTLLMIVNECCISKLYFYADNCCTNNSCI